MHKHRWLNPVVSLVLTLGMLFQFGLFTPKVASADGTPWTLQGMDDWNAVIQQLLTNDKRQPAGILAAFTTRYQARSCEVLTVDGQRATVVEGSPERPKWASLWACTSDNVPLNTNGWTLNTNRNMAYNQASSAQATTSASGGAAVSVNQPVVARKTFTYWDDTKNYWVFKIEQPGQPDVFLKLGDSKCVSRDGKIFWNDQEAVANFVTVYGAEFGCSTWLQQKDGNVAHLESASTSTSSFVIPTPPPANGCLTIADLDAQYGLVRSVGKDGLLVEVVNGSERTHGAVLKLNANQAGDLSGKGWTIQGSNPEVKSAWAPDRCRPLQAGNAQQAQAAAPAQQQTQTTNTSQATQATANKPKPSCPVTAVDVARDVLDWNTRFGKTGIVPSVNDNTELLRVADQFRRLDPDTHGWSFFAEEKDARQLMPRNDGPNGVYLVNVNKVEYATSGSWSPKTNSASVWYDKNTCVPPEPKK